jgi:hypothetical protein
VDEETLRAIFGDMSEAKLESQVRLAVLARGGLYYHTHDSRRSDPGFPDCVIVIDGRILWRELKDQKGKLSAKQVEWGEALTAAGQDWAVWRPFDWGDGTILKELE